MILLFMTEKGLFQLLDWSFTVFSRTDAHSSGSGVAMIDLFCSKCLRIII